jgi:hypothetical protein
VARVSRIFRRFCLVFLALVAAPASANETPQAPEPDPRFIEFLRSDGHRAAVLKAATEQAAGLPGGCPDARFRIGEIGLFRPPQLDGGGRIVHGLWREQVMAEGCGTIELLNIFALARPGGDPQLLGGLPGTTRADLVLQRRALPIAVQGAVQGTARGQAGEAAKCTNVRVVDTVLAADAPSDRMAPWRERWTVLACDEAHEVPLRFTPAADGATIEVEPPPHS